MTPKKTIIFHSPLDNNAPADELDVLHEAEFFQSGLLQLSYQAEIIPFPYDLMQLKMLLETHKPDFVVNLVETIFGNGKMVHMGPFMFEHFKMPYTGCSAHSMYLSSHKILAKQYMNMYSIPTPSFYTYPSLLTEKEGLLASPFLVKSLWEHASFGMDESKKLLFKRRMELLQRMEQEPSPEAFFAEEYIHGREFNLSVIESLQGPMVLPPAEIRFEYPDDKPRILGYKAKWEEESFEYKHTVRTFDFPENDALLLKKLETLAIKCWNSFELNGYARVDFRVAKNGNIFVLEINANPCISPDSGFVAAAQQAGISNTELVKMIIDAIAPK